MQEPAHLTPMFRQYRTHKRDHPDAILLFRMGDFYEMFFDDAREASQLLELTLTSRGKGSENVVPMCGFPHHQLDAYTAKLVQANLKVAICDQVEDPKKAKGLVRREVVRIVTPGTITDPGQLESKQHSWIVGIAVSSQRPAAAFLDASTGEFLAWTPEDDDLDPWAALADRIRNFQPREIVLPEGLELSPGSIAAAPNALRTTSDPAAFSVAAATQSLIRQFGVASLDGFGLRDRAAAISAAGGLLDYVREAQRSGLTHIDRILLHEPSKRLLLDAATRRNLELERSIRDGSRKGSLIDCIDSTRTAAGGRLLRGWLLEPLLDCELISRRQAAVAELVGGLGARHAIREHLTGFPDLERLLSRVVSDIAGPRDLSAVRDCLLRIPEIIRCVSELRAPMLREVAIDADPCVDVAARIAEALVDDPPASLRDGGVIRPGHHAELDELRSIRGDGKDHISAIESRERESTGIASLKVRFNKVFGYYIEVSRSNLGLVPAHYDRKQTIANGERFVTAELKEYEAKVLHAQERILEIEVEKFGELRRAVGAEATRMKALARIVAQVDAVAALAETAAVQDWVCPVVRDEPILRIVGGRHPVVERHLSDSRFVPNDSHLAAGGSAIAVLTGPNMGGKSTYLRQVAVITILAQAGSFVPASEAEIGVADRIFCRVGASDSLAEGQSTFMVEMAETAKILHYATARSLVILDEIGRGTSTFDGLSIAWAVVEHLHGVAGGAPRTLFATHYHELTELAVQLSGVFNLRMAVRERGTGVAFLHRVEPGAADRSYGIHVARLAGLPRGVIDRATVILANLERDQYGRDGLPRLARGASRSAGRQADLFGLMLREEAPTPVEDPEGAVVLAELRESDPDRLTPLEALTRIVEWRRRLRD